MRAFDDTYADLDFQQQIADARDGWMDQVPKPDHPDLHVEGMNGSFVARLFRIITRKAG